MPIEIFLSHSHKDALIAKALVSFLVMGVGVETKEIRCTSYIAASLASGDNIVEKLRKDLKQCTYFMPLITQNSLNSDFVNFEIGAAWVLDKDMYPLFLPCTDNFHLPSLLSQLLCRDISKRDQLIGLAEDLAKDMFYARDRPSAGQIISATDDFLNTMNNATTSQSK